MPETLALLTTSLFNELGPNPRQNIHILVRRTSELLKCDSAVYGCIEPSNDDLRFRAVHKLPARPSLVREFARRLCGEIIAAKRTGPVNGSGSAELSKLFAARDFARTGIKSFLGHPVTVDGQNIGALVSLAARHRKFSRHDQGLIALLSGIVAAEESCSRHEEALRRRVSLEKMLKDLSTKAIAVEDSAAFTEHCLQMLGSRMGVGGSFLWEFNPKEKTLSNTAEWLAEGRASHKMNLQNIPVESVQWAFQRLVRGDILRIDDVRTVPATLEREILQEMGVRACLIIPLFSQDAFFGFMGLECYRGPRRWIPDDILILQTAAEIMMRGLENKQLTEELIRSRLGLQKAVAEKTIALQRANERLATEVMAHKTTISALKSREAELQSKNQAFMKLSNALAALVSKSETDLTEAEESTILKINQLIDPGGARTISKGLSKAEGKYIGTVRESLKELSSLLRTKSMFIYQCLTPMEIEVANLIKQGLANKEIADLLNLSRRTVEVHRYNIRKKLQLDKTKMNLKTFLSNME